MCRSEKRPTKRRQRSASTVKLHWMVCKKLHRKSSIGKQSKNNFLPYFHPHTAVHPVGGVLNVKFLHEKMKIDVLSEEMKKIAESAKRKMVKLKLKFVSSRQKMFFHPKYCHHSSLNLKMYASPTSQLPWCSQRYLFSAVCCFLLLFS